MENKEIHAYDRVHKTEILRISVQLSHLRTEKTFGYFTF